MRNRKKLQGCPGRALAPVLLGLCFCCLLPLEVSALDSWAIPLDGALPVPLYRQAEEVFINAWEVPPFEDLPVLAGSLQEKLAALSNQERALPVLDSLREVNAALRLPLYPVSPLVELGASLGYQGNPDLYHLIGTQDYKPATPPGTPPPFAINEPTNWTGGRPFLDFMSVYEVHRLPALMKLGLTAQLGPWALLIEPVELRAATSALLQQYNGTNFPPGFGRLDVNFPYRGLISYSGPFIDGQIGRDRLQVGPGEWSSLILNRHVPYYDHIKVRFHLPWFGLSWFFIRLNPIITQAESDYLDYIYQYPDAHPEDNTQHQKIHNERSKHLTIAKIWFQPLPWLTFSATQQNLIGGRVPQLSDVFPFILFHNTFEDGLYGVPVSATLQAIPYKGVKLYATWYFYDAVVADETGGSNNAGASAYQAGFSLLSTPFFTLGPGRFRLDSEFNLADPWCYNKYNSLRKFTSRIVYVDPYSDRYWVDYPLGFYLGPDALELACRLSYGQPDKWEAQLSWQHRIKGAIDLYGYGLDSDYAHMADFPVDGWLSGTKEWSDILAVDAYYKPVDGLKLGAWLRYNWIRNYRHEAGRRSYFGQFGVSCDWKIF